MYIFILTGNTDTMNIIKEVIRMVTGWLLVSIATGGLGMLEIIQATINFIN